jgi:membrane fusion protein (multidrug efflux system)
MSTRLLRLPALVLLPLLLTVSCGGDESGANGGGNSGRGGPPAGTMGGGPPGGGGAEQGPAVPVEAAPVERRAISSYIETNGVLEAENEVDIVARVSGPIVLLQAEEGDTVRRGQLLARIDDKDIRSDVEIARVALEEARLAYERSEKLHQSRLISPEAFEQASTRFETAKAQYENNRILLGYTEIMAPFSGHIVTRYVDLAEQVNSGTPLFRISDFDPLLCPIQVPERELPRLALGQDAYLTVEAWRGERFPARVLRVSPVVDAATGTVKVTLHVEPDPRLRPGMFTRVFLETERHENALVIPKAALSLESLGDTVYVVADGEAERRDVILGFREENLVEVVSGLEDGERVVVVGQDGLSQGTPIQVLGDAGGEPSAGPPATASGDGGGAAAAGEGAGRRMDPSQMTPEQIERARTAMRARGMSEKEIDARLERRQGEGSRGERE